MAEVQEKRVDHIQGEILHVYDGIEEADNALPLWWLWTFYGAILFAVGYWFVYHEFEAAPLPQEAYAIALQERAGDEVDPELLAALANDPGAVQAGHDLFDEHCVVCHKERGEGNIGPNLTDAFWIHGGSAVNIHDTISEGVLSNGMPAWGQQLGSSNVQKLTAFVLSIRDTNVEGKEPQGERWTGEESEEATEDVPPEEAAEAPADAEAEEAAEAPTEATEAEAEEIAETAT